MIMVIEQTSKYPYRMVYDPETNTFSSSDKMALAYARKFFFPYGWLKESGTPPEPHCDCMLMTPNAYEIGDEVLVKIIGMFKRNDGDHKYIVVERSRSIDDFELLTLEEKEALRNLYPRIDEGEGWFGREEALHCFEHGSKAL